MTTTTTTERPTIIGTNRYRGTCRVCSRPAAAGAGWLVRIGEALSVWCDRCTRRALRTPDHSRTIPRNR